MLKNLRSFSLSSNDYDQFKKDIGDAYIMSKGKEKVEGYGFLSYEVLLDFEALKAQYSEEYIQGIIEDNNVYRYEYLSPLRDKKIDGKWTTIPPQLEEIHLG